MHKNSASCTKGELDIFAMPGTQTAIDSSYMQEIKSINPVHMTGPMEFVLEGSSDEYTDLNSLTLYTKFKVTRDDGGNMHANDVVALEQNALHSMFSQVDVTLGDTVISHSDQMHHYRAYIDNLLSYGSDAHKNHVRAEGMKLPAPNADGEYEQVGEVEPRMKLKVSPTRSIELMGALHVDVANQEKLMISATNLRVKLTPNKKDFYLKVGASTPGRTAQDAATPPAKHFSVRLEDVSLWVRKVRLNPAVFVAHAQVLQEHNAVYPMKRVEMKTYTIPQGSTSHNKDQLYSGVLPTRLIVGLVNNGAFNGNMQNSGFEFEHFGLTDLTLYKDGAIVTGKALQMNYARGEFMRAYINTLQAIGKFGVDEGIAINQDNFHKGFALYAFDLTPDQNDNNGYFDLVQKGSIRLDLNFAQQLAVTTNVVCYAEFDSILQVSRDRNVQIDWS